MGGGRAPCCDKKNVKRGPWSPAEDMKLAAFIQKNGHGNWRSLPKLAGASLSLCVCVSVSLSVNLSQSLSQF